jgi:hypothetical protein
MYMTCRVCVKDEAELVDCAIDMGKYFPEQGWYEAPAAQRLNDFYDKHQHGGAFGDYFGLVYESGEGGEDLKSRILGRLSEVK